MAVVAGIDEAGFGPLLGPLVVSTAAFDIPDELLDVSMWQSLSGMIARAPSAKRRSLIPIGDSKRLYSGLRGNCGVEHLERGVLAMLATAGHKPDTLRSLLAVVSPECERVAKCCPWYELLDLPLPQRVDATSSLLDGNALASRMKQAGIRLLGLRSEVVLEGEFNRLVTAIDNKSSMLFDISARLLVHVWRMIPPGQSGRMFVDHQGGRVRYLEGLQRVFEGCRFTVRDERENFSGYTISDSQRSMEVSFLTEAEDQHLPVALASMVSKYLRESFMALLNAYFARHMPGLQPTAGYYTDGKRFYEQILPVVQQLGLDQNMLYRCR